MKIALGLSGGVDSSMCALILQKQGHEVTGVTLTKWSPKSGINQADKRGCFGPSEPQAVDSAIRLAKKLDIEHHVINLEEEFRSEVLDYYTRSYTEGRTPNPCVVCNQRIKFGSLWQKTRDLGIDFDRFATGHYARIAFDPDLNRWQLLKAMDHNKDQSYFLSLLSQEQLAKSIFPLGNLSKDQIREFAQTQGYGYLVKKKESQDFLESEDSSPLFEDCDFAEGDFVDLSGKVLGRHRGLIHYTIGQRKGLGLAGFAEAQYVVGLDPQKNRVIIGPGSALYGDSLKAIDLNWVSIPAPRAKLHCQAKIRLAQDPVACLVENGPDGSYQVKFESPISAITPGQLIAFYDNDLILGAGFIA